MAFPLPSEQVEPAALGGFGKIADLPSGGLQNMRFDSRCPPIVVPATIVIAVCGPNDYADNASPDKDGWFFSDFYLFHHLLQGTAQQQYWLTCVDPATLVKKYRQFVHGDPRGERRIVLEESMLQQVKDVLVFSPNDLLERFYSYVADACKQTKNTQRPILLLLFGHGQKETHAITVGGTGAYPNCPRITKEIFRQAILRNNSNANISLFTTSCYGGGWSKEVTLNITTMTASSDRKSSLSWPQSESYGRCCGSRYATGVARALIRTELEGFSFVSDEGDALHNSPSFAALISTVHSMLKEEVDPLIVSRGISFSAKDDGWDDEWRLRSGFPLTTHAEKWNALGEVEQGDYQQSGSSHRASVDLLQSLTMSASQATHFASCKAWNYYRCSPGPDYMSGNHAVHSSCNKILNGNELSKDELVRLLGALTYRMEIMNQATEYKEHLGLTFEDCQDVDVSALSDQMEMMDNNKVHLYEQVIKMVRTCELFDEPGDGEGMPYDKGEEYLAFAIIGSGWSLGKVRAALNTLARDRSLRGKEYWTVHSLQFRRHPRIREIFDTIRKDTKRPVRELSALKKTPSLPVAGQETLSHLASRPTPNTPLSYTRIRLVNTLAHLPVPNTVMDQ